MIFSTIVKKTLISFLIFLIFFNYTVVFPLLLLFIERQKKGAYLLGRRALCTTETFDYQVVNYGSELVVCYSCHAY